MSILCWLLFKNLFPVIHEDCLGSSTQFFMLSLTCIFKTCRHKNFETGSVKKLRTFQYKAEKALKNMYAIFSLEIGL